MGNYLNKIKLHKDITPHMLTTIEKIIQRKFPIPTIVEGIPYCLLKNFPHYIVTNYNDGIKSEICLNCAWEQLCPGFPFNRAQGLMPSPLKGLPNEVVIEICKDCQLSCNFCRFKGQKGIVNTEKILEIIDTAYNFGVENIRLTGGEPLLHPQLETILKHIHNKSMKCLINTNAISSNLLKIAQSPCVYNILASIQYNDITNSKIISQKLRNIVGARQYIQILRVGTVITSDMINNFDKIFSIIKKLPIHIWELYRPLSILPINNKNAIGPSEWKTLAKFILQARAQTPCKIVVANSVPFCHIPEMPHISMGNFPDDGHNRIVFSAIYGEFTPSYFSRIKLGGDLKSAWMSEIMMERRNLRHLPPICNTCYFKNLCKGGSYSFSPRQDPMIRNNFA